MSSPFPGMDPFLEHPAIWPDVHNSLIAELRRVLGPQLRPRYYVSLEERTYLHDPEELAFVSRPDLTVRRFDDEVREPAEPFGAKSVQVPIPEPIRETYLEVRGVGSDEIVTVLELLSPANKRPGTGRALYEKKRTSILGSLTHLVEVDLVRVGEPMRILDSDVKSDYRILVSRSDRRPTAGLYAFTVRDPIPIFALPLRPGDEEPRVDLGTSLRDVYETASYDLRVDYDGEPSSPLGEQDIAWMRQLIAR